MRDDLGRLLLRLSVGGLMLFHGFGKIASGVAPLVTLVGEKGLPRAFGYAVYAGEVIGPLLVVLGVLTRPAAAVIAINMVVAVWLAHTGDLFHLGRGGGYALELQALYFFGALAIALLGAGRFALGRGRWN